MRVIMGILIVNEPNEHPALAFRCLFWVVSGLMDNPSQGHTQNEQFIRPQRRPPDTSQIEYGNHHSLSLRVCLWHYGPTSE